MPYLPIDPKDVGREYDSDVIRINSQSGKGGVGYVMEQSFGIKLPAKMKETVGYAVKDVSDKLHKELKAPEIYEVFRDKFLANRPFFDVTEVHYRQYEGIEATVTVLRGGEKTNVEAHGNGRLDAVSNALKKYFGITYVLSGYEQHALTEGSTSQAISYVGVEKNGKTFWGAGVHDDIITSSIHALVSAVNNLFEHTGGNK